MHIVMKIFSEKEFFLFVPSSTYGRIGEKYLICKKIVSINLIDYTKHNKALFMNVP